MPSPADLLTASEAGDLLHVTDETVRRWAKERKLRFVRLPSGQVRFRRADVEAVLEPVEPTGPEAASA